MTKATYVMLRQRGILAISGDEARPFLQGLISNDIERVTAERAIYAALLTPQGKYLFDFMIVQQGERLLLDTEAGRLAALIQRLTFYKLRAKVDIEDVSGDFAALALPGRAALDRLGLPAKAGAANTLGDGVAYADPRLIELGARAILPTALAVPTLRAEGFVAASFAAFERLRLGLGVPDGSRDMVVERATLLESGFEELNGVDFNKGCFVGQELTARMKYRALVRKRLMPVTFDAAPPPPGTTVRAGQREVGEMRSAMTGRGLALLRLDKVTAGIERGETLTAGDVVLQPARPDWMTPGPSPQDGEPMGPVPGGSA